MSDAALWRSTEHGETLGLFGRSAVHPGQLPVIDDVFTPADGEVAAAREVVAAYEATLAAGAGMTAPPDGRFVDLAVVELARVTLAAAGHAGCA